MVYTQPSNVTVPAPGTPVRLASERTPATWVLVAALADNSGTVYVGGANPSAKQTAGVLVSGQRGIPLMAGDTFLFPQTDVPSPYDLQEMWVDAAETDDGVSVTYLVR